MATTWEEHLENNLDRHIEELFDLLRIPSISALPAHAGDTRRAAEWVADALRTVGVPRVELLPTAGNPVVYGEWIVDAALPTALIYGHYDVQPPDPLDLWDSPPFEPVLKDGKIYARGASDDKGNLFVTIKALEALVAQYGAPPINLKFSFEGEEEIGSPNLPPFVRENKALLEADVVLCADGGQHGPGEPSIAVASKGIAACQVNIVTANTDLHSGGFGASVPNAVQAAVQLAATLHDSTGRIAVAGFYDRVRELTAKEREEIAEVPFDEEDYRTSIGVTELWGEPGFTPVERNWTRPTIDLNGIWGGFSGDGIKTVTPCEAHFKITSRLVKDQEPGEVLDLIEAHLLRHAPVGAVVSVDRFAGSARPYTIERDHPALQTAWETLGDLFDRDPYVERAGGTLPVAETFQTELGADLVFYSFGMPGSQVHAPNENFLLQEGFVMGRRAYCALLERLATWKPERG